MIMHYDLQKKSRFDLLLHVKKDMGVQSNIRLNKYQVKSSFILTAHFKANKCCKLKINCITKENKSSRKKRKYNAEPIHKYNLQNLTEYIN